MSISIALANAATGLRANAKLAETVSGNVANALTEGYARREVDLRASDLDGAGRGVFVTGVRTAQDIAATRARRDMGAQDGANQTAFRAAERVNQALGEPNAPGSLAQMVGELDAAFVAARNAPSNQNLQRDIAARSVEITNKFKAVSTEYARVRQDADTQIAQAVDLLNTNLAEIERLNFEVERAWNANRDVTGFEATRQNLIDEISDLVPLNVIKKDRGRLAIFSAGGGTLLDYYRTDFAFNRTPMITHDMSAAAGDLSLLDVNGTPNEVIGGTGVWAGGKLEALMVVRDQTVPKSTAQLDGLARDMIERFQDPAVDPTLAVGDPAFFTDGGVWFDTANEVGLAGRIELNSLLEPSSPELWRMQSGLNAAVPLNAGDATILANYADAFAAQRPANAGLAVSVALGAAGFASEITGAAAIEWSTWEYRATYSATQSQLLRENESNIVGVDSDQQMQMLIEIENAYAANARVMSVADEMFSRLMEI